MDENMKIVASRVCVWDVDPLIFEGKRYEEVVNAKRLGMSQRTGVMAISDIEANKRIALVKIYEVPLDPEMEEDVQDVFFTDFELNAERREIFIRNERKKEFVFSIDTAEVRAL